MLLNRMHLTLQMPMRWLRPSPASANARRWVFPTVFLEVARKAGHLPLGTRDRDFSKLVGAELVTKAGG